jgi:hypothetical protein
MKITLTALLLALGDGAGAAFAATPAAITADHLSPPTSTPTAC